MSHTSMWFLALGRDIILVKDGGNQITDFTQMVFVKWRYYNVAI